MCFLSLFILIFVGLGIFKMLAAAAKHPEQAIKVAWVLGQIFKRR